MKKSLSVILGGALAFGAIAGAASAATPTDVAGVPQQSAIEELGALGIINGYADGSFKPNNNITRAELAKIVVEATGGSTAASIMQSVKPTFKDVKANAWYTGYINVAATKGYIQGDAGTGKFRPNDNIKFEEASAIVLRALGYSDKNLQGSWPYNVLVKSEDVGLFSNVDIKQGTLANRAIVSQIIDNALTKQMVQWNNDSLQFDGVVDTTVAHNPVPLISKLGTTTSNILEGASLDSDGKIYLDSTVAGKATASSFIVTGGHKLADLLGHTVNVLWNADKSKVLAVTDAQVADSVVTGTAKGAAGALSIKVTVNGTDKTFTYATATPTQFYLNNDVVAATSIPDGAQVTVFLKDGNANTDSDVGKVRAVVATTNAGAEYVVSSYVAKTSSNDARLVFKAGPVGYVTVDANTAVKINGETKTAADLKENDVLFVTKNASNYAYTIDAYRNTVQGKVTAESTSSAGHFYTIDGKQYKDENTIALTKGATYKLYLDNSNGYAWADLVQAAAASNDKAVILSYTPHASTLGTDGVLGSYDIVKYYSVVENAVKTALFPADDVDYSVDVGQFVTANYDPIDGSLTGFSTTSQADLTANTTISDITASNVTLSDGKVYALNNNTVVVNSTNIYDNTGNAIVPTGSISLGALSDLNKNDEVAVVSTDGSGYNATYVFLLKNNSATGDLLPAVGGKLVGYSTTTDASGNVTNNVTVSFQGTNKTVAVDATRYGAISLLPTDGTAFITLKDVTDTTGVYDNLVSKTTADAGTVVTAASIAYQTFTSGSSYVVTANTDIYVYDSASGTITAGAFADILNAKALSASQSVVVTTTGKSYGVNQEASVVIVKK